MRPRARRLAESLRGAADRLPGVSSFRADEEAHGRRFSVEGQRLVCDRLPGQGFEEGREGRRHRQQRSEGRRQTGHRSPAEARRIRIGPCGRAGPRSDTAAGAPVLGRLAPRVGRCREPTFRRFRAQAHNSPRPCARPMLKKYFVAGLLIWLPLAATLWVLDFIVSTMDRTLLLLPQGWRPDALFGVHIPGFGLILSVTVLLLTGVLAANFLGAQLLRGWETLLTRIPIVRSIYSSVKQVSDTLFSKKGQS